MKKIYSLVLLATTLLFSTNVMAQNVCTLDGVEKASLLAAFNEANASAAQSHTITLLTDVNIEDPALITNSIATNVTNNWAQQLRILGKDIVLNMNGHSINSSLGFSAGDQYTASGTLKSITKPKSMRTPLFIIYKGSLSIEGTGTINNGIKESGVAVALSGSNVLGTTNFSILTVGKDVTLLGGTTGTGIYIDHHCGTTKNANSSSVIPLLSADELSSLGLSSNVKNCGYGVVINVNGKVYGGVYGIQISGNVSARPTDAELDATKDDDEARAALLVSYPTVHINEGSLVYSEANASSATGIYAAGYGNWFIAGTVQGSTGAYMKSGNVDIVQGAVIESTNTTNYNETVTGKKSGIDAGGSAIVIEATVFYAGGNSLDINGGDIIAASGYAIDENRSETTPVGNNGNNITITAGNFQGGDEGLLKTTDEVKEKIKEEGTITGGVFDAQEIQEYLPNINGYIQYADGGDNKYQVVPIPATEEIQNDPATAADDSYVKMEGTTSFTVANGEIRTFAALMLTSDDNVVRVQDGGKLVVSNAATILGNAKIIVEAGGQFIIEGAQGLIANDPANLVLETSVSAPAIFLINPAVIANTNPQATVEFIAHTGIIAGGTKAIFQRFGVPFHSSLTSVTCSNNGRSRFYAFDYDHNTWNTLGYINGNSGDAPLDMNAMADPFQYYQLLNYASTDPTADIKYTMTGSLVGNVNPSVNVRGNFWNGYANSFMGKMLLSELLEIIPNTVDKAVYTYDISATKATWEPLSLLNIAGVKLNPMQPFLIRNTAAGADFEIDYAATVYNPAVTPVNPAPARRVVSDMTVAQINIAGGNSNDYIIVAEDAQFTASFDNGYDAAKYMNEGVNIYVDAEEKMSIYATDNLSNVTMGFAVKEAGEYTLSFSKVSGDNLTLLDQETGARIAMIEGNTYSFNAEANANNNSRFVILTARHTPTDVEEIAAEQKAAGIYTILGEYVGAANAWNSLPAGVYIVNGEKRVK